MDDEERSLKPFTEFKIRRRMSPLTGRIKIQ
jgi:hypothetical protein